MKTVFFMILGLVLGAVLGALTPIAMALVFQGPDFFQGKAQPQGVGTVYAILMIITTPIGAALGVVFGMMRGRTGKWQFPSTRPVDQITGPEHALPEEGAARTLAPARVSWFLEKLNDREGIVIIDAKESFLKASIADYKKTVGNAKWGVFFQLLFSLLVPFIFVPFLFVAGWKLWKQIQLMRSRLHGLASDWDTDLSDPTYKLPLTLRRGSVNKFVGSTKEM